jgi:hypothetical protein
MIAESPKKVCKTNEIRKKLMCFQAQHFGDGTKAAITEKRNKGSDPLQNSCMLSDAL